MLGAAHRRLHPCAGSHKDTAEVLVQLQLGMDVRGCRFGFKVCELSQILCLAVPDSLVGKSLPPLPSVCPTESAALGKEPLPLTYSQRREIPGLTLRG